MKYNIEFIRLLAVILITFTHTRSDFIPEGNFYFFLHVIPRYGTLLLSLISGYLYWNVSRSKQNLFRSKVKSLLIPYLIANVSVLLLTLFAKYVLQISFLNRLDFDYTLITEGIFSLSSPPIDPPTYFIRDIFMIFVFIELIARKNLKMLLIIVPYLIFGKILIRTDILILFVLGILTAQYKHKINPYLLFGLLLTATLFSLQWVENYSRYFIAVFFFILFIDIKIRFYKTGAYSYILHLFHAPVIVLTFPLISKYINDPYLNVITQIGIALVFALFLFFLTRRFSCLRIITGGR